jgi:molybdate transport system substrate-binding protein
LARQIAAGAPADIFISANEKWMDWLEDENLLIPNSRHDLLANRLVLIAPSDKALETRTISANTNLISWISPEDRIAVGDPDHVPAGIYAKSALISLDQWDAISPRLARADNVRAALALVERGEVPLGIVYQTDAGISDRVKIIATFPQDSHPAITYPAALIAGHADTKATKFFMWLLGDDAGRIFTDYGFEPIATPQSTVPDQ